MNVREISASRTRAQALNRLRLADSVFRMLTRGAAVGVLIILGGVILSLFLGSLPALQIFGLNFLVEERWNPVTEKFGALAPIYGTIVTSFIAMLIAVPVGLMVAFFLTELCPPTLTNPPAFTCPPFPVRLPRPVLPGGWSVRRFVRDQGLFPSQNLPLFNLAVTTDIPVMTSGRRS